MMGSKARMRALRETVGLTQADLAAMAGVDVRTVKRWEREDNHWGPPEDVTDMLERCLAAHREAVGAAVGAAACAPPGAAVHVRYYRDQAMYDAHGRDGGPVGVANANARAAAEILAGMGYDVGFSYPGESAAADLASLS